MEHARIDKAIVMEDQKTGATVLMGYASYRDAMVNFKVPYNFETLDIPWFLKELREVLARDLDVAVSKVDISDRALLGKMQHFHEQLKASRNKGVIIH